MTPKIVLIALAILFVVGLIIFLSIILAPKKKSTEGFAQEVPTAISDNFGLNWTKSGCQVTNIRLANPHSKDPVSRQEVQQTLSCPTKAGIVVNTRLSCQPIS